MKKITTLSFFLMFILGLSGCAQLDSKTAGDDEAKSASKEKSDSSNKKEKKTEVTETQNIPASGKISEIKEGMSEGRVMSMLGAPDLITRYSTGKRWIPFAGRWMSDARRQSWFYENKGYIVMSQHKYTGQYKVLKIKQDSDQKLP